MTNDLDGLLGALGAAGPDRRLESLESDVQARLAELTATTAQTWKWRTLATALVVLAGALISASGVVATASAESPTNAWSRLAPSSLLESD